MTRVPLVRALSKLGALSRSQAGDAIRDGRVRVEGRVVRDQARLVDPARARIDVDGRRHVPPDWRTVLLHKPKGVVTSSRDPEGRPTVFDVLGDAGRGLVAVGRLDLASSGLLLLTTDTHLAAWLTDPAHAIPRSYVVTVRGRVDASALDRLTAGVSDRGETLRAAAAVLLKASGRESHLTVELRQGRNREIRRLFDAIGHEVTRLKRVGFGPLDLGDVPPGAWRDLSREDIGGAFGPQALGAPAATRTHAV